MKLSEAEQKLGELEFDVEKLKLENEGLEQKIAAEKNYSLLMSKMYHQLNKSLPDVKHQSTQTPPPYRSLTGSGTQTEPFDHNYIFNTILRSVVEEHRASTGSNEITKNLDDHRAHQLFGHYEKFREGLQAELLGVKAPRQPSHLGLPALQSTPTKARYQTKGTPPQRPIDFYPQTDSASDQANTTWQHLSSSASLQQPNRSSASTDSSNSKGYQAVSPSPVPLVARASPLPIAPRAKRNLMPLAAGKQEKRSFLKVNREVVKPKPPTTMR